MFHITRMYPGGGGGGALCSIWKSMFIDHKDVIEGGGGRQPTIELSRYFLQTSSLFNTLLLNPYYGLHEMQDIQDTCCKCVLLILTPKKSGHISNQDTFHCNFSSSYALKKFGPYHLPPCRFVVSEATASFSMRMSVCMYFFAGILSFWRGYLASCFHYFPSQASNFALIKRLDKCPIQDEQDR